VKNKNVRLRPSVWISVLGLALLLLSNLNVTTSMAQATVPPGGTIATAVPTAPTPPSTVPQICQNKTAIFEETDVVEDLEWTLHFTLDVVVPAGAQLTGWRFWLQPNGRPQDTISLNTFSPGQTHIDHTYYRVRPGKYNIDITFVDTVNKTVTASCFIAEWRLDEKIQLPMILQPLRT
jgi:hypothetical protein